MYRQPEDLLPGDIDRMSRHELIAAILEVSKHSTFQFTPAWLRKQWTSRLRTLYRSVQQGRTVQGGPAAVESEAAPREIAGHGVGVGAKEL